MKSIEFRISQNLYRNKAYTITPSPSPTPSTDVPTTVLYVSQTPPTNIIHNGPQNVGTPKTSSTQSAATDDYLETAPQDVVDNQPYSLLNGWIIIDPTLIKKLNLIWSQI